MTNFDEAYHFTRTQVSNNSIDGARQLVIGLDFGTSTIKVVVRDHDVDKMYAILFNNHSYLQSTSLFLKDDVFNLHEGERMSDLKYTLMIEPNQVITAVTAYIALILRYARYYLLNQYEKIKNDELV